MEWVHFVVAWPLAMAWTDALVCGGILVLLYSLLLDSWSMLAICPPLEMRQFLVLISPLEILQGNTEDEWV